MTNAVPRRALNLRATLPPTVLVLSLFFTPGPSTAQAGSRYATDYFSVDNASASMSVNFAGPLVEIDSMSPGGKLLWFAVARQVVNETWTRILRRKGSVEDDDGDGKVEIDAQAEIPILSVWLLVDIAREEAIVASPKRIRRRVVSATRPQLRRGARKILGRGLALDVMWLRPGVGIWHTLVRDGSPEDTDGIGNREVNIDLFDFEGQFPPGREPPETVLADDLFVLVDEETLQVLSARIE